MGGVVERVTRTYPRDNVHSRGRKSHTMLHRKARVLPLVFSRHLRDKMVFLSLQDIAADLPPITEHVHGIEMDDDLGEAYRDLEGRLTSVVREAPARGSKALAKTISWW